MDAKQSKLVTKTKFKKYKRLQGKANGEETNLTRRGKPRVRGDMELRRRQKRAGKRKMRIIRSIKG